MHMGKLQLLTDSTCDLSQELIDQHDIAVIPLYVNFGEDSYKDGEELVTEEMYKLVSEKNMVPKTAATSPGEFETVFKKYLDMDREVLYLGIGSKFSATFQNANIARNMLDTPEKVHLIDSQNLSSGSGILLLKAAKFIDEGMSAEEIVNRIETLRGNVRTQFVIDTLEYLHKGGRLKAISAFVGSVLKLHPIIKVVDGEMTIGKKPRGKLSNGVKYMLRDVYKDKNNIDSDFLLVTHSMSHEHADLIKRELEDFDVDNIIKTEAGCVISSHCGKGTIGIIYIVNE